MRMAIMPITTTNSTRLNALRERLIAMIMADGRTSGQWKERFMRHRVVMAVVALGLLTGGCQFYGPAAGGLCNVRRFGARGDGKALDTSAINRAIEAASAAGGGTVRVPAGVYRCYSIHLKSNVALQLDQGAIIRAAESSGASDKNAGYDPPEPNPSDMYQDFGHTDR